MSHLKARSQVSLALEWQVNRLTGCGNVGLRDSDRGISSRCTSLGLVVQSLGSHRRSLALRTSIGSQGWLRLSADVAQPVELLFCKQEVRGSSPLVSSDARRSGYQGLGRSNLDRGSTVDRASDFTEGCPSGQWEQAVNLPAYAFDGSNPSPSTLGFIRVQCSRRQLGWQAGSDSAIKRAPFCGSSSVGRASAFQAERRGFESHFPLRAKSEHVSVNQRRFASAHLAQMVERVLGKDEVTSSILVVGSKRFPGNNETYS